MRNYISRIQATNWQGRNFDEKLSPLTVIVSENQRGKTSILNAIRVALLGHSPKHGKRGSDTMGFAGAIKGTDKVSVRLEMRYEGVAELSWQNRGGKVVVTGQSLGNVPTELLDIGEFLKKSGPDRTRHIFGMIDLDKIGFNCAKVTAYLRNNIKIEPATEDSETAVMELLEMATYLEEGREANGTGRQVWMETLIEQFKLGKDSTDAAMKSMAGLIQGPARLAAADGIRVSFDPAKLAAAEQEVATLELAIHDFETLIETNRKKQIERGVQQKIIAGAADHSSEIAKAEKYIEAVQKEIGGWISRTPGINEQLLKARTDYARLNEIVRSQIAEAQKLESELPTKLKEPCCPFCRSKGKGWKESLESSVKEMIQERLATAETHEKELDRLKKAGKKLADELIKSTEEDKAIDVQRQHLSEVQREINDWRNASKAVEAAKARLEGIGPVANLEALEKSKAEFAPKLAAESRQLELQKQAQRDDIAARSDKRRQMEAEANHVKLSAKLEVFKLAVKAMDALKNEMKDKVFGTFMDIIRKFTDGILTNVDGLPVKLEYREGEIGYWYGATWVSQSFFSGTQDMLCNIGLAIALAQASPLRLVTVDEWLGSFKTRLSVRERFADLITAEVIDQAIIIDVSKKPYEGVKAVTIIEV